MWRRLLDLLLRRTPAQHHAALSRRLRQAKDIEEIAAVELRRIEDRQEDTRATRRASKRLMRLRRRTNNLAVLVAAARPLMSSH